MVESQSTALPLGYTRHYRIFFYKFLLIFSKNLITFSAYLNFKLLDKRIAGIEPAPLVWKTRALPLCNIRLSLVYLKLAKKKRFFVFHPFPKVVKGFSKN